MSQLSSPPAPSSRPPLPRNVKVLGLASLLNDIASEMIFPLLPNFLLTVLLGNRFALGVIEGAADSVASLLKLWSGGRSDRAGRRKGFVLFGYSLAAVTRPLIGIIVAPWQTARRPGRRPDRKRRPYLATRRIDCRLDRPRHPGRAFGFDRAMDHLGAAIGPLLAAGFLWLWPDHLPQLFLLTVLPGCWSSACSFSAYGRRRQPSRRRNHCGCTFRPFDRNFRLTYWRWWSSRWAIRVMRSCWCGPVNSACRTIMLPLLWCAFHVVKSTSNLFLGRAVDRFGPRPFLFCGWLLYAGVYLAFALATTAWHAWAFFLAYALFYGLTEPAEKTLVAELVGERAEGAAFGWYNFAIGIATLPASLIFGALYQVYGRWRRSGCGAALALVAVVLLARVKGSDMPLLK